LKKEKNQESLEDLKSQERTLKNGIEVWNQEIEKKEEEKIKLEEQIRELKSSRVDMLMDLKLVKAHIKKAEKRKK